VGQLPHPLQGGAGFVVLLLHESDRIPVEGVRLRRRVSLRPRPDERKDDLFFLPDVRLHLRLQVAEDILYRDEPRGIGAVNVGHLFRELLQTR
jgi:hypothetical protein